MIALDNLSTGHLDNLKHHLPDPHFRFVEGNVLDKGVLKPLIEEADFIHHLAAAVGVKFIVGRLIETLETMACSPEIGPDEMRVLRWSMDCPLNGLGTAGGSEW